MTTTGDIQRSEIVLRLESAPRAGRRVIFKADKGTLSRDTVFSNSQGYVRTAWYRSATGGGAGIAADVQVDSGSVLQFIELKATDKKVVLTPAQVPRRWRQAYVGTGTRPIVYEVQLDSTGQKGDSLLDPAICSKFRVAFSTKSAGATVRPDTASGNVYDVAKPFWSEKGIKPGCFVMAHWRLGSDPEKQELRVSPVTMAGYRVTNTVQPIEVTTRRLPQFVLAASTVYYKRQYRILSEGAPPGIKVEVNQTNGKISYDSVGKVAVDTVRHSVGGLVGAIIPLPLPLMAIALGVDVTEPKRSQYFGISVGELLGRSLPQKFPLDILILAQRTRIDELKQPITDLTVCSGSVTPNPCKTTSTHVWGAAAALSVDAGALVADVIKLIAK